LRPFKPHASATIEPSLQWRAGFVEICAVVYTIASASTTLMRGNDRLGGS